MVTIEVTYRLYIIASMCGVSHENGPFLGSTP